MSLLEVKIPPMGESITSGILAQWHVADAAIVKKDQPLFELETDKITSEGTAEAAGKISFKVAAGDEVKIGQVVATIDPTVTGAATPSSPSNATGASRPQIKRFSPNEIRKFREHVGQLEKKVSELEAKQGDITNALEDPASYADKGKFHQLNLELSTVVDEIAAATAGWEEAVTKLAEMEA